MFPSWYAVQFHLGPIPVNVWGLFVAAGFLLGTWIAVRQAPRFRIAERDVVDVAVWVLVAGMIGARIGHVLLYDPAYYLAHPFDVVKVWQGGLSSFGGFVGALVAAFLFVRRRLAPPPAPPLEEGEGQKMGSDYSPPSSREGAPARRSFSEGGRGGGLFALSDLLLWPLLLGWFVGRLGCYSIHDHAGIPCNGYLCVPFPDGARRLDMGLLDGLLALAIALAIAPFRHRLAAHSGATTAAVIGAYGVGRFALDFLRVSDATYLGLTPAQYGSVALVGGAAWLLVRLRVRHS